MTAAVAAEVVAESFPALAHPSYPSGRHPGHQRIIWHIVRDHGTGGDEGRLPDRMAADNGTVGTQRGSLFDQGLGIYAMHREMSPRRDHIGEHATGATEDIVLNLHPFINRDVVLDTDTIADSDIVAYIDILAKRAMATDTGTFLDVAEVPYLGVIANKDIVVHIAAFMNKRCRPILV